MTDKQLTAHLAVIDNRMPKYEMQHILVNSEHCVSTDTRLLLVTPTTSTHKPSIPYLHLNPKAKWQPSDQTVSALAYPEYKRIMLDREYFTKLPTHSANIEYTTVDALYYISTSHNWFFDYVEQSVKLRKLAKNLPEVESYSFREPNLPIQLNYTDGTKLIIMPLVFN